MKAGTILMIGILAQVLASGIVMTADADDTDAATQTWTSGACTCTLDTDTGVFTVSGTGAMADYANSSDQPWASDRANITSVIIQSGVTNVGNNCFYDCNNLADIDFGSITSIGAFSFYNCTSLASVILPSTLTSIMLCAFQNCTSLASVIIGSGVTSIETQAFKGCTSLTIIIFEATTWNITSIGSQAFVLGNAVNPVTATVYSPNNVANGQLDSYKNNYTTLNYVSGLPITVTIAVNDPTYGSVSQSTVLAPSGTSVSASGNILAVGFSTSTATPATPTAQYTYTFDSWSGIPAGGTITEDVTVTANFTQTLNTYTITIIPNEVGWGSVSTSSVTVDYGTQISAALNVLSVGSTDVTATPSPATPEYSYAFDSWQNVPSSVTGDATITANFTRGDREYTVTISIGQSGYGSVDVASVQVLYGTSVSASSNVLSVGSTDVTATPTSATAQYTYAFVNWTDIPSGGEITDDTVITANFSRTVNQYTVTIVSNDATYGTVDVGSVTVDYGTSVSASSNVLSVGSTDSTATPTSSTAQYTYAFDSWSGAPQSGDVQADVTITAVFTRTTNQYTVTISVNNAEYGSVSSASMTIDYGTSVSTLNNVLTIGSTDVTATPQTSTAQYTYAFGSWTGAPQTVTEDVTITANFTRTLNQYTISIVSSNTDYGTVSQASITVDYGTTVSTLNNVLTIGSTDVTATANQPTAQYTYAFGSWQNAPETVTENATITAVFTATVNQYTVTISVNDAEYGSVSPVSVTVDYGTPITAAQNVLTIGSNTVTATPTASTAQYTYAFGSWNDVPETVTGDATVTAVFTRTINEYTVTISVSPEGYGTVDLASVTVPYGTQISVSGNVLTVGETAVTATPTPATAQYTYSFDAWSGVPGSVTGDANVTAGFSRTINVYTITYNGNGGAPASVTETYEYGASADLTKRVIKSGYDFLGWNTESTATEPLSSYTVTGDAVLFAVFEDHVPVVIDAEEFIGALTHTETQRNMYGNVLILIPLMVAIAMIVGLLSYVGLVQTRKN